MAIIRALLGSIILLLDWLTTPRGIKREASVQLAVNEKSQALTLYQYKACPFCVIALATRRSQQPLNQAHHRAPEPLMREVELTREPVALYKILKFEGLVTTGGEAKLLIGDGQVKVNGEVETRKSRKIVNGDTIEFAGESLHMRLV